ncbi:HTH-type transcriptional regulator MetR [Pseudoalteromonas holothuriae]|uniref:HTH-type transcriptional regulator MetR n=1 Tax=Pseudoalteromonas holothuriae TaxID=2963714 RepID=A0A9W4QRW2_9GAMM|nr:MULTISPECIES: LysR family transcriptional regulator [unclassified Pseudoalteromonas]CAH9050021.1 HTH-type transcriptional regulator MetR [Pseudoalteromonas sp. CIP111854]CAH9052129.1 HTH-type transcriptional regulator MetR [Pseudoalteromonas sp. CIP111951]
MLERIHLEILTAIKQHGTLTKAADSLHLSQSALSHSIKKLEGQVGTNIWEKEGRNLRLTAAGERIQTLANRVLPQFLHTELLLSQIAKGEMGSLRIGMECHPCYQWLLRVIQPYLEQWPEIDMDVKQEFQFGALGALLSFEIDVLITPDPLYKPKIDYIPVFNYEHRLVVCASHKLAEHDFVLPNQLSDEVLFSYPVEPLRLDIFSQFLNPAKCSVKKHKIIETTEIMLQMVAAGRGVCALPGWLVDEHSKTMPIKSLRFGEKGISKQIFVGIRKDEQQIDYLSDFITQAKKTK